MLGVQRLSALDRRAGLAVAAGAALAVLLLVVAIVALRGDSEGATNGGRTGAAGGFGSSGAGASDGAGEGFPTSDAPIARLIIPAIGIDQPTVEGRVENNEMVAPEAPFDIAYYTYSAQPGRGNAVFSGHVDYVDIGPAVFWNLRKLKEGDDIVVRLQDGLELRYKVTFNVVYSAESGPWDRLFGKDAMPDALTLYTCDGEFDRRTQNYADRRVVRAVRVG